MGDIAVDSISVAMGSCSGPQPPTVPPTQPPVSPQPGRTQLLDQILLKCHAKTIILQGEAAEERL